ncbi:uncharacterized protein LOC141819680 [Curcuma longa]|uniref:uncharacterized protein LOC141819680 n=1 Tax=Curcuma longa TaxID=136217 RepID=UPI003D9DCB49
MEGSPRRISSASASSPEFQFWAVFDPPPPLLTADELFADGVLLPLHHLSLRPHLDAETDAPPGRPKSKPEPDPASPAPRPPPAAELTASISCSPTTGSKRWKDIFRVGEKKPAEEKERRKDRKGGDGGAVAVAELNINIWPFSRSRSAGSAARPSASASGRRVSSAPCSRSNSRGESSKHHHGSAAPGARRWAASPGRPGGVMVGRASPVWQIRRPEHRERDKVTAGGRKANAGAAARVMNASIGYRGGQRSCRGDDKDGVTASERTGRGLFSLMTLFSKKVH